MSFLVLALGYLLGSIPFSYIIGRVGGGVDLRRAGTGNVGAHNLMREVGRLPGIIALVLDLGKGAGAALLARSLGAGEWIVVAAGLAAVTGHIFPVWLGFQGGGGLATSVGLALTLLPREMGLSLVLFALLYLAVTRNIAFSAGVSLVLASLLAWTFGESPPLILAPLMLVGLMLLHQLPEVVRLWRGAKDKRALIREKFIFDKEARI